MSAKSTIERSVVIDPEKIVQREVCKPKHFVFQCDVEAATTGLNTFLILKLATLNKYAPLLIKAIKELPKLRTIFLVDQNGSLDLFFDYLKDEDNAVRAKVFEVLCFPESIDQIDRMMHSWSNESQDQLIARAHVKSDELVVTSFGMKIFRIKFDAIKTLNSIPTDQRSEFEISGGGRKLVWPSGVDITIETIRYHSDSRFRIQENLRALTMYGLCGQAIKQLRGDLSREAIHRLGGPSAKQQARVEGSSKAPTMNVLTQLAKAHKLLVQDYMKKLLQTCETLESEKIAAYSKRSKKS